MPPSDIIIDDLFPNPATPDLGCFVRRKHGLETEPFNIHVEFTPSIDLPVQRHQVYFRVICGKAAFFQRALVFMTTDASIPGPILENFPPDWVLGGDFTPHPSDWLRYPIQLGQRLYWFFGQHRNPAAGTWRPDGRRCINRAGRLADGFSERLPPDVRVQAPPVSSRDHPALLPLVLPLRHQLPGP